MEQIINLHLQEYCECPTRIHTRTRLLLAANLAGVVVATHPSVPADREPDACPSSSASIRFAFAMGGLVAPGSSS